jgi:mono/diheme cytochrome c family protein
MHGMRSHRVRGAGALGPAAVALALVLAGCAGDPPGADADVGGADAVVAAGAEAFAANCAVCHGPAADGTTLGPPLVHEVYEPSHHGDAAFLSAVRNGVQPHHWDFGPMPPLPGVSDEDVAAIVAWVRAQQRRAGIE